MSENVLKLGEAASYLNISHGTLRRMLAAGSIRAVKVGGCWRFRLEDLRRYLDPAVRKEDA